MFDTAPADALKSQVDRFEVPTFIAERDDAKDPYRILALNTAHERVSGMRHPGGDGIALNAILPEAQARAVTTRYASCTTKKMTQNYSEKLSMPSGVCTWNTTLHPIVCDDGRERLIGLSVLTHHMETEMCDVSAFEDIQYFASGAMLRLGQITELLEAVHRGERSLHDIDTSAMLLASICRSVDAALVDLRSCADARLAARKERPALLGEASVQTEDDLQNAMRSLTALIEDPIEFRAAS
ncbi:MAG: hypothetical protein ACU0DW_04880 [Shimia sp.]